MLTRVDARLQGPGLSLRGHLQIDGRELLFVPTDRVRRNMDVREFSLLLDEFEFAAKELRRGRTAICASSAAGEAWFIVKTSENPFDALE